MSIGSIAYFFAGSIPMMSILNTSGVAPDSTVRMKLSVAMGYGRKMFRLMTAIDEESVAPRLT